MTVAWVTAFLDLPASDLESATTFWLAVTGTTLSPARGDEGEFTTLVPPDGDAYLKVQRVSEGAGGVHLDLHVEDVAAFAGRAVSLGATEVARPVDGFVVLRSPGGFTFCVVAHPGSTRPTAGNPMVDQVCLDIPRSFFEQEVAFWTELTGWELRPSGLPEFRILVGRPAMPIRLLLQRLADERSGPVTGHLDLAAGERVDAVAAEHETLGAQPVRRTDSWTTMRDPTGREYCVTDRDPATGVSSPLR